MSKRNVNKRTGECTCQICGNSWTSMKLLTIGTLPRECVYCKSYKWNVKKKK